MFDYIKLLATKLLDISSSSNDVTSNISTQNYEVGDLTPAKNPKKITAKEPIKYNQHPKGSEDGLIDQIFDSEIILLAEAENAMTADTASDNVKEEENEDDENEGVESDSSTSYGLLGLGALGVVGIGAAAGGGGGGGGGSSPSPSDTIAPTVTSITVADSSLIIGETTTVTVVFSEAIAPESLVLQDFSAENGVLSDLSVAEDRLSATLTLTPDATIEDTANVVSLTGANFTDAAGNLGTGTGTSNSYAVDTVSPTMNSAVVSSNGLSIVITYSELVGGTLEPADYAVTIDGQAYSGTIDAAVIGTDSDANKVTLTLSSPIQSGSVVTNLIYTANAGAVNSVTDVVGNPAASQTLSSVSNGSSADTIAPTVTSITVADSSLIIGETTTVTVVFRRRLLLNRWYCKIFLLRMVC
ncbi:MAG: Ig-like domain-containing protein [Methylophilaceae bacterium]|nr:MAG: Ig-like domain-containing protein [Methylophilaceae bacterium]